MPSQPGDGRLYIDGAFVPAASGRTGSVEEKATGKQIGSYALGAAEDIERAVAAARGAQPGWAALSAPERSSRPASAFFSSSTKSVYSTTSTPPTICLTRAPP